MWGSKPTSNFVFIHLKLKIYMYSLYDGMYLSYELIIKDVSNNLKVLVILIHLYRSQLDEAIPNCFNRSTPFSRELLLENIYTSQNVSG